MTKFINFICNEQHFALSIDGVEKILLYGNPTIIPDTSDYISGFQSYNEAPLILIDMKKRLFKEKLQPNEQTKVIVTNWNGNKIGLIVEQITTVREYPQIDTDVSENENAKTAYLVGTFQENAVITLHIDVEKLFTSEGEQEIVGLIEKQRS
ncbi:chemotaxis protein CheW [Jeotgalibaca sp. A122]|uniref:chemotaxis protein CheW n=1 Tax=Jeotgalibaca sp. A122 TaxID=3457322 RepID=UPI003FCF3AD7